MESADEIGTATTVTFKLLALTPVGVTRTKMIKGELEQLMQNVLLREIGGTNTLCCQAKHLLVLTL